MQQGFRLIFLLQKQSSRFLSKLNAAPPLAEAQSWDIYAAVALLRPPFIAPQMTPVEKRYSMILQAIEKESSLLSDFELKEINDKKLLIKRAQLEAEGKELSTLDELIGITAEAQADEWSRKGENIKSKFRIGDLSKIQKDSVTSLWRCLDEQLVLLVKQKFGRNDGYCSPWILPQMENRREETLRQTAERCLGEIIDGDLEARITSNAPFTVHWYRYAKGLQRKKASETVGAKVFFFNAIITQSNDIKTNESEVADFKWVNAREFSESVVAKRYKKSLSTLFIDW